MIRSMIVIAGVLVSLTAQDFESAWQAFYASDNLFRQARSRLKDYQAQTRQLQQEIAHWQQNDSWLTGWYAEMRLAAQTARLVALSDSAANASRLIDQLERRRREDLARLKTVYRTLVDSGQLTRDDKARAINIGQWLIRESADRVELPDYRAVAAARYSDQEVRRLVLGDLQVVVTGKISQIDALITQRREAEELLARLGEFHADLNLQQESDRDLGSPVAKSVFDVSNSQLGGYDGEWLGGEETEKSRTLDQPLTAAVAYTTPIGDRSGLPYDVTSLPGDTLLSKRRQYLQLLEFIDSQLAENDGP